MNKELSIEEKAKAKAYDSMFERLKEMYNNNKTNVAARLKYERYFPELKESEGEKMRKVAIEFVKQNNSFNWLLGVSKEQVLDWLEKPCEHANFRNKIQIGDKVTRNRDGVLVNLSQLNRVAKKEEPVSKDFEMALAEMVDKAQRCVVEPWVIAAQWKDELIKLAKSEEPVSDDLGEYINELSKQFPEVSFAKLSRIAVRVSKWQKEQMMAKAIDVTVHIDAGGYPYIPQMELYDYDYDKDVPLAKAGDRYKVILIKEG